MTIPRLTGVAVALVLMGAASASAETRPTLNLYGGTGLIDREAGSDRIGVPCSHADRG